MVVKLLKNLNFYLIILTLVVLTIIGLIFIGGTIYSWQQTLNIANWRETLSYQNYVASMNFILLPFVLLLVVTLVVCIPKRLFTGLTLLQVAGVILILSLLAMVILGPVWGAGFMLLITMAVQLLVVGLTVVGSRRLTFERTGFFSQIGSALLHLGLVLFIFNFIVFNGSPWHLTIFWVVVPLVGLGMFFSFYDKELARVFRQKIVANEKNNS